MNLYEAAHLARELMGQHGLPGWTFGFDHARLIAFHICSAVLLARADALQHMPADVGLERRGDFSSTAEK